MAPEQISGRPVDGRCDVYSLACVLFEMLTGSPPFRRDDDMALLWAHQYDPPPALTELRPDLSPAVDEVFAQALSKAPENRYETCRGFVAALRTAGRTEPPRLPPDDRDQDRDRDQGQDRDRGVGTTGPGDGAGTAPPPPPSWAVPVFPGSTR